MPARINKLIEDARRDPRTGIGQPEPLKYHLPGAWSRRTDDEHRLVYLITEAEIPRRATATDDSGVPALASRHPGNQPETSQSITTT